MLPILIAFFTIIFLMVCHEFGHFLAARKFNVEVEEFGIGYKPRIWGRKIGKTFFSLNLLPFGAFVKIKGEEGTLEDYSSLNSKPIWQRALILLGGIISFWLIAAVILSLLFATGIPQAIDDETPLKNPIVQIVYVAPNSIAEALKIKMGDMIVDLKCQNEKCPPIMANKLKEVSEFLKTHSNEEIILTIKRGGKISEKVVILGDRPLGIQMARISFVKYPFHQALLKGFYSTFALTFFIFRTLFVVLGRAIIGQPLPPGFELIGPVGIGSLASQFFQVGFPYFLQLLALVSIGLAVANLLPIPAADGGKLLFLLIEAIRKKPIPKKIEQNITAISMAFLLFLMVYITIKDIIKLF